MAIHEIRTARELLSLRSDWLALWKRSSTATPFQSPDWVIPWWQHFGTGRLCVLALMKAGELLGLAPLFVNGEEQSSLRFVGTGNTDYLDVLLDDSASHDSVPALFNYICETRSWLRADLENLRADSPLLKTKSCREVREYIEEQDACPVLSLPACAEDFVESLPQQLKHNVSYYRRKLAKLGDVTIEQAVTNNFTELFAAFVRLHEARWQMNRMCGVLAEPDAQSFLREASLDLLANGALRLYALRVAGRVVASLYGFHHARRTYYYLGGFDPEFSDCSPGTVLVAHAILEAIGEGATEFDFLRGREDYKYRWGAVDHTIYRKQLTWM